VVGGGIAGLLTALELLRLGADVTLFESLKSLGSRRHCAGIVSIRTIEAIPYARSFVDALYSAARIFASPRGPELRIVCSKPFAAHMDRVGHEQLLAEKILERGADVRLGALVIDVRDCGRGLELTYLDRSSHELKRLSSAFDAVVVAEGFSRRLSRALGLEALRETFIGVQRVYAVSRGRVEELITVFDSALGRGGFAWLAPLGEERALVGVVGEGVSIEDLDRYARLLARVSGVDLQPLGPAFGGYVFRGYPKRLARGRVVGIGDCVCMVKSLSGGGLYAISESFRHVAHYLVERRRDAIDALKSVSRVLRRQYRVYRVALYLMRVASIALRGRVFVVEMRELDYDRHDELLGRMMRSLWGGAVKRWRRADSHP